MFSTSLRHLLIMPFSHMKSKQPFVYQVFQNPNIISVVKMHHINTDNLII